MFVIQAQIQVSQLQCQITQRKYEKEETLGGETVHFIYLYPKNAAKVNYHTIILYISKSTNELKKAILKSKDATVMTYSLSKFTGYVMSRSKESSIGV